MNTFELTGPPASGKSTIVGALRSEGYEISHLFDTLGVERFRANASLDDVKRVIKRSGFTKVAVRLLDE